MPACPPALTLMRWQDLQLRMSGDSCGPQLIHPARLSVRRISKWCPLRENRLLGSQFCEIKGAQNLWRVGFRLGTPFIYTLLQKHSTPRVAQPPQKPVALPGSQIRVPLGSPSGANLGTGKKGFRWFEGMAAELRYLSTRLFNAVKRQGSPRLHRASCSSLQVGQMP